MPTPADLLAQIADPARPEIDARRIAIVLAHPDDESIGCGALLPRLRGVRLIVVTDGAPGGDAEYAAKRRAELQAVCDLAGLAPAHCLYVPDQRAAFELAPLSCRLAAILAREGIELALTHAYEGGHPDHDAVCFAVHAARRLGASAGILEMPLYRLDAGGMATQSHPDAECIPLTQAERAFKRQLVALYPSQTAVLADFGTEYEAFLPAPDRDFAQLPNDGALFYAGRGWGVEGEDFLRLARKAWAQLGLARAA